MADVKLDPKPNDILHAISLKCSSCYGAMSFANALGGTPSPAWELCHGFPLKDLIEKAEAMGLDARLDQLQTAAEPQPIKESLYYKRAKGMITEEEFRRLFRMWQKGESNA